MEEVDGVLLTKFRGSTATSSAGTSYLASGRLRVLFCLPRRKQQHIKRMTRINNAHAPVRRPTSSVLISVPMVSAACQCGRVLKSDLTLVETAKDLRMLSDLRNLQTSLVLQAENILLNFEYYYRNKQCFFSVFFMIQEYYWLLTHIFFSDRYFRFLTAAFSKLKWKWPCTGKRPGATYFRQGVTSQILVIKIDGRGFSNNGSHLTLRCIISSIFKQFHSKNAQKENTEISS